MSPLTAEQSQALRVAADQFFAEKDFNNAKRTDRLFALLMAMQWAGGILLAWFVSPLTWLGSQSQTHTHLYAAIFLGGAISSLPIALAIWRPGETLTRHVIAVAQMLTSALLIHLSGGRLETHFHVFGSLAFLAFYLDVKVLLTATVVTLIDHVARGIWFPQSIYGVLSGTEWRFLEHAAWVVFENMFLIAQCRMRREEMHEIATSHAEVQAASDFLEAQVQERTIELAQAYEDAKSASRAKDAILETMSHELRTPMHGILGMQDGLLDSPLNPDQRQLATDTREMGFRLLGQLDDLLAQAELQAGNLSLVEDRFELFQFVDEWAKIGQEYAASADVEFAVELTGSLPKPRELWLLSDTRILTRAVRCLLKNAASFSHGGRMELQVELHALHADRVACTIAIADRGPGIPEEDLAGLFEPFVQADSSSSRLHQGAGLGLSIAARSIELLGGNLQAANRAQGGSRFAIQMEFARTQAQCPVEARRQQSRTVLVVDDNPVNLRVAERAVRKLGFDVDTACNGQEAVDLATTRSYVAVLMDCQMPVMDGIEATRQIRAQESPAERVPIIALTANDTATTRDSTKNAGMDGFLPKPLQLQSLQSELARWAQLRRAA